jgi:hypothetical protein
MSADIQNEYPFDITYSASSGVSFAELDLSQTAFLNPGQLPWSEAKTDFKVESSPVPQPVFYADPGNYTFYNDSTTGTALDAQLFSAQSQSHQTPEVFVQPSDVMLPSPPAFPQVPFPRVLGSSSPPGLTGESDEDMISESGESETADPSEAAEGDDDGDFIPSRMSLPRTRSRRTSSVSVSSGSGSVRASRSGRMGAPVPVPNLTKKSRGRRVPTAPVFIVQGGVQKNMRMYRCTVDGCYKCFARGEHLKRHVRSIHTNEKRECPPSCHYFPSTHDSLQRTNVLWKDAERTLAATITSDSTCVCTKAKAPWLTTAERVLLSRARPSMPFYVYGFFFGTIRHVTLLSSSRLHMYFYHCSRLSTKTPPRLLYPSMCIPYSIFL